MRKIILFSFALLLIFGCTQTIEERAAEIAKAQMEKILYNIESYSPIETRVDSAYTSIYTDRKVVGVAYDLIKMDVDNKKEKLLREYNHAKSSVAIWSDSPGVYGREQYRQAKEEMDNYAAQLKELDEEINSQMNIIRERVKDVVEDQFYGWNIYHRFRCTNGYDRIQISEMLIIVDEKMEIVQEVFLLDDNDEYNFDNLIKIIDKSIDKY